MASKTEIANWMLTKAGDSRVSNIETDSSERAQVINEIYENVRDQLLQKYPWVFATKRTQLAKDGTAPAWGFKNRYKLPADFLSLQSIKGDPDYRIEGGYILSDDGAPLYIQYTYKNTETGTYDPLFVSALSSEGAVEISERINASNTKKQILAAQRDQAISDAFANDAIQDPPQNLRESEWVLSREASVIYDEIDYNA